MWDNKIFWSTGDGGGEGGGDSGRPSLDPEKIAEARIVEIEQIKTTAEELKKVNELLSQQFEIATKNIEIQKISLSQMADVLLAKQKEIDQGILVSENLDEYLGKLNIQENLLNKITKAAEESNKPFETAGKLIKRIKGEMDAADKLGDQFASSISGLANKFSISADAGDTLLGKVIGIGGAIAGAGREKFFEKMMGSVEKLLSPVNILGTLLDRIIKLGMEFDAVSKEFQKTSGASTALNDSIIANRREFAGMGISITDVGKSMTALRDGFGAFNQLSKDQRDNLTRNIAIMEKYGVSTATTVSIQQGFMKSLKMTDKEATFMMTKIAANAKTVGTSVAKMSDEFASAFGYLSQFGDEAEDVFLRMSATAAAAGVSVARLLELGKDFDKFSSGAEKAASVNAIFGTSLSSMALMTMDAAERIDYLQDQFHGAGIQVDNLTRAQKLALTESMGFSNVAEMMALLGSNTAEANAMREKMDASKNIEENMANALNKLLPIMDQITAAFDELASHPETIKKLTNFIQGMTDGLVFLIENLEVVSGVIGLYTILTTLAAMETYKFSFATSLAYGKIGLIIGAFFLLIKVMTKPNSPPLYLIFGVLAVSVFFFGRALDAMGPKAIIAAVALALLAGAISLVFYGISAMVESITGLFSVLIGAVGVLPQLAAGMYLVGSAFLFLGFSAMTSSAGILMGLGALTVMLATMALTGTSLKDVMSIGEGISKIGSGIKNFGEGLKSIKSAAVSIKESMADTMIAATMEGTKMSVVVGKEAGIATLFKNDTLNIKVDMPEIKMPTPNFVLEIDGEFIKAKVKEARVGATG